MVVGRGDNHGIELFVELVEHLPIVGELGCFRMPLERLGGPPLVNVAQGDKILAGGLAHMAAALAAATNHGNVQFLTGRLAFGGHDPAGNPIAGRGNRGGLEKLAASRTSTRGVHDRGLLRGDSRGECP